jgi:glycosyltransferase involved in cell wall biosynthesis
MEVLTILMIHDKGPRGGGTRVQIERTADALRDAPVKVERLRLTGADDEDCHTFPQTFWPHQGWLRQTQFLKTVADLKPDVIHVQGSATSLSAPLVRAAARRWPVVATLHDVGLFCQAASPRDRSPEGKSSATRGGIARRVSDCRRWAITAAHRFAKASQRRAWRSLERLMVPSQYMAGLASANGFAEERLTVVPNICPLIDVPPLSTDARPHVLFVGTLSREKGADLVLEALALLPSSLLTATFVGEGPDRLALEQRARELDLRNITFVGWQTGESLERLREQSTVGVFPSRVMESFGLSGAESLAAGRPVVGISRGGASEWLIDGETGLAVLDLTPQSLAHRLSELASNHGLGKTLGEQGRELVARRFSPAVHKQALLAVYAEAVAARSRKGA